MYFGRWLNWRARGDSQLAPWCAVSLVSAGLLAGCGEVASPLARQDIPAEAPEARTQTTSPAAALRPVQMTAHVQADDQPQLAALMPALNYLPKIEDVQQDDPPVNELAPLAPPKACRSLSSDGQASADREGLYRLPPVSESDSREVSHEDLADSWRSQAPPRRSQFSLSPPPTHAADETAILAPIEAPSHIDAFLGAVFESGELSSTPEDDFIGNLLPPQALYQETSGPPLSFGKATEVPTLSPLTMEKTAVEKTTVDDSSAPLLEELSQQERLLASLTQEASSAATGALTDKRLNDLAKTKIQHAFAMASRGSLYVARQELIEVLRMISQGKDAQQGSPERSVALASGLRALREAEDFVPSGAQLEAELNIAMLCASHRTPLAKRPGAAALLPRLMQDRYLRYAQFQLAMSAAGDPAGSMALHALGKLSRELKQAEPNKHPLANRQAIAFQQAALLAHNQNHLAAHELGVLLATSGHLEEARQLLLQVAARESNPIVYRNLARVQEQLGEPERAIASRDLARQLGQQGATETNFVQWVSPSQFIQTPVETPPIMTARRPTIVEPPTASQTIIPGTRPRSPQRSLLQ